MYKDAYLYGHICIIHDAGIFLQTEKQICLQSVRTWLQVHALQRAEAKLRIAVTLRLAIPMRLQQSRALLPPNAVKLGFLRSQC